MRTQLATKMVFVCVAVGVACLLVPIGQAFAVHLSMSVPMCRNACMYAILFIVLVTSSGISVNMYIIGVSIDITLYYAIIMHV